MAKAVGDKGFIAVLGKMGELGAESEQHHFAAGEALAEQGCSMLITVGKETEALVNGAKAGGISDSKQFPTTQQAAAFFAELSPENNSLVLVKGSRVVKLENFVWELGKI